MACRGLSRTFAFFWDSVCLSRQDGRDAVSANRRPCLGLHGVVARTSKTAFLAKRDYLYNDLILEDTPTYKPDLLQDNINPLERCT
jgi:hypothetical protein